MNSKSILAILFAVMLVLGTVPIEALAQTYTHLDVTFTVEFNQEESWDVGAIITLYDEDWLFIGEEFTNVLLTPDANNTQYTFTFTDIPVEAVNFGIVWDIWHLAEWDPESPIFGEIDWQNYDVEALTFLVEE